MRNVTISSSAISLQAEKPLTPAMLSVIWEIAGALDSQRVPSDTPNAVWVNMASSDLRGVEGRSDNFWLRQCLERLNGIKITGESKGDPWGAVVIAEWHLENGGSTVRMLIPPAAIHALRSPRNFDKIEARALHGLTGHGRKLYVLLSSKKSLQQKHWTFGLDELRDLMGVADKKSYQNWSEFRRWVIEPALEAIDDYGSVKVTMSARKTGRIVTGVRFDWQWRDPHEATETAINNERHSKARRKDQTSNDAPPMIDDEPQSDTSAEWWGRLTDVERGQWSDRVGRVADVGRGAEPRPERIIRSLAYEQYQQGRFPPDQ